VKVKFDIDRKLYNKFQAAMTFQEKDENEVVNNLIAEYLKNLLNNTTAKDASADEGQKITSKKANKVDPYSQKRRFVEWFKQQTYQDRPYNPVTISGYTGRIEHACQSKGFSSISTKNLFEIADIESFRAIRSQIEKCDGFNAVNTETHNGFTAALNMYDRFLRYTSGDDSVSAANASPTPNSHRWTYSEDELCCKRYFETFVIKKNTIDLTRFAELLHKELPDISIGSLKMKAQNIKYLCDELKIPNSLVAKSLSQYSAQSKKAFIAVCNLYGIK